MQYFWMFVGFWLLLTKTVQGLTASDLYRCDNCKAASNCRSQIPGLDTLYPTADECMKRCISAGDRCKLAEYHNASKSCNTYTCSDIEESTGYISYRYSSNRVCSPYILKVYPDTAGVECWLSSVQRNVSNISECINICLDTDACQALDLTSTTCILHSCILKRPKPGATFVERICQEDTNIPMTMEVTSAIIEGTSAIIEGTSATTEATSTATEAAATKSSTASTTSKSIMVSAETTKPQTSSRKTILTGLDTSSLTQISVQSSYTISVSDTASIRSQISTINTEMSKALPSRRLHSVSTLAGKYARTLTENVYSKSTPLITRTDATVLSVITPSLNNLPLSKNCKSVAPSRFLIYWLTPNVSMFFTVAIMLIILMHVI